MKVIMLDTISTKEFSFIKGEKYKALDGDEVGIKELRNKILIRQPNSPSKENWWCQFNKMYLGNKITII